MAKRPPDMNRIAEDCCFIVSPDAISCPLGDGLAILDTQTNSYFSLNITGAMVWDLARTSVSLRALRSAMIERFDCEEERCEQDLQTLIGALLDAGLLQTAAPARANA